MQGVISTIFRAGFGRTCAGNEITLNATVIELMPPYWYEEGYVKTADPGPFTTYTSF